MKVIPHCGLCEPESDATALMDGQLAAKCAHCGSVVTRQRRWKQSEAGGIAVGDDVFICTPPEEQGPTPTALA